MRLVGKNFPILSFPIGSKPTNLETKDSSKHVIPKPPPPPPRVGYWFQAQIPDLLPPQERELKRCPKKVTSQMDFNLAWSPYHNIPEEELERYIQFSKETSGFNEDQSLALLSWHEYNMEKAINDQRFLEVRPDGWTRKEINQFKRSKHLWTKNFFKIHRQLTKKTRETDNVYKSTAKCVSLYYGLKMKKIKSMGGIVEYKEAKKRMSTGYSESDVDSE